jgi:hypothetical protein
MTNKFVIFTTAALCCLGCRTSRTSSGQRLQSAAAITLAEHHFAPPTVVQGANGVVWIVAARPRSDVSVDVAKVQMEADGRATVHIVSYQYGPSDWALLGRMFAQGHEGSEASTIETAIHEK